MEEVSVVVNRPKKFEVRLIAMQEHRNPPGQTTELGCGGEVKSEERHKVTAADQIWDNKRKQI